MRDREIRRLLQTAYVVEPSEKEKIFVKKYERRELCFMDVLVLEFKYMGLKSCGAGCAICAILYLLANIGSTSAKWMASGLLPLFALMLSAITGSSERYGMQELEAASRFSLRLIRVARMLIWGAFSLVLIMAGAFIFRGYFADSPFEVGCYIGFPYLFNAWGCLLVIRKWHSKDNIYGCIWVTAFSCTLPLLAELGKLRSYINGPAGYMAVLIMLAAAIREALLYIRDGEELSWNLC